MTYLPPKDAIRWYRQRFDAELTRLHEMCERSERDSVEKEAMLKVFRLIRWQMLPPTDGCVVTMFDERMHMIGAVDE